MWDFQKSYTALPEFLSQYSLVLVFPYISYISTMTELKQGKRTLVEYKNGILDIAPNFDSDSSKFFNTVFCGSQWPSLEPCKVKI